jgi:hypothetical protein
MFLLAQKGLVKSRLSAAILFAALALGFGFPAEAAETPSDSKRTAFETIDRNAEQIATVGDVLYYFGEPEMQEHESSKYLKENVARSFEAEQFVE